MTEDVAAAQAKAEAVRKTESIQRAREWAHYSKDEYERLKALAPTKGLDANKIGLGFVLRMIVSDDANSYAYLHTALTDNDFIVASKLNAQERLDWEIGLPEIPECMRRVLVGARQVVSICDWTDVKSFNAAKTFWTRTTSLIEAQMRNDPNLLGAFTYYESNRQELVPQRQKAS